MPRRSDVTPEEALHDERPSGEDWMAQPACPECGGRPGQDPATGMRLVIHENGKVIDGHTYNCLKRPRGE